MISINTTEKWVEFDFLENPIKSICDRVWVSVNLKRDDQVTLGFTFGKMSVVPTAPVEEGEPVPVPTYAFDSQLTDNAERFYTIPKTKHELAAYSYAALHDDAKAILESTCLTEATFKIV